MTMDKLTSECIPYIGPAFVVGQGYVPDVLPKESEVDALELAFLRWERIVTLRYGDKAGGESWRRACKVVRDFERGE